MSPLRSETCRHADAAVEMPAFRGVFAPVGEIAGAIAQMAVKDVFTIGHIRRDRQEAGRSPFKRDAQGGVHETAFVYAKVGFYAISISPPLRQIDPQRQHRIIIFVTFCGID